MSGSPLGKFHLLRYLEESFIRLSFLSYEQWNNENSSRRKSLSRCRSMWIMSLQDGQDGCMIFCLLMVKFVTIETMWFVPSPELCTFLDISHQASHRGAVLTRNFPSPNVQKATGDEFYQLFHMTSVGPGVAGDHEDWTYSAISYGSYGHTRCRHFSLSSSTHINR